MLFSSCISVTLKLAAGRHTCCPAHAKLGLKDWVIVGIFEKRNKGLGLSSRSRNLTRRALHLDQPDARDAFDGLEAAAGPLAAEDDVAAELDVPRITEVVDVRPGTDFTN
jgi:hypothetical protein